MTHNEIIGRLYRILLLAYTENPTDGILDLIEDLNKKEK